MDKQGGLASATASSGRSLTRQRRSISGYAEQGKIEIASGRPGLLTAHRAYRGRYSIAGRQDDQLRADDDHSARDRRGYYSIPPASMIGLWWPAQLFAVVAVHFLFISTRK